MLELGSLKELRFSNSINNCSNLAYLFLLLFFLDFLSLGSGQLTEFAFGLSTREVFFAATLLFSLPLLFPRKKEIFCNWLFIFLALFLVVVAVNVVRGYLAGNELAILKSDLLGYLNLILFPAACVLLYSRPRLDFLLKLIVAVTAFWAFCSLILSYHAFFPPSFAAKINNFFNDHFIAMLSVMGEKGTRVFLHTASRWMFPAFLFATYFAVVQKRYRALYIAAMVLFVASLAIAYSRAFYLGIVLGVTLFYFLAAIFFRRYLKTLTTVWGITLVCSVLLLGSISISQQFNIFQAMLVRTQIAGDLSSNDTTSLPSVDSGDVDAESPGQKGKPPPSNGTDQDDYLNVQAELDSNAERAIKIAQLSALIAKNPLFGSGLGTRVAYGNGYVEYFYYDLVAKMGFWGLLCFLLPFLYGSTLIFRNEQCRQAAFPWTFFTSIVYFFVISYFNPCLNSVAGLSLYVLFLTVCFLAHNHVKIIKDGVSKE